MFFCLSKNPSDKFPNNYRFGSIYLNVDEGWKTTTLDNSTIVYKGYLYDSSIEEALPNIMSTDAPTFDGNFCAFKITDNSIEFFHSLYRTFPLYYKNGENFTNLYYNKDTDTILHANFCVLPFNYKLNFEFKKIDYTSSIDFKIKTEDEVVEKIYQILYNKIEKFLLHNKLPLKSFLTGGVDSMLVYSFVKKITESVEIVDYYHFYLDQFYCKNSDYIKNNYWAYKQIHHWKTPCVLLSGTPGDEYMLRSPTTSNMYLMNYNSSIPKLIANSNHLHSAYFKKSVHLKIFEDQEADKMTNILVKHKKFLYPKLCEILIEDFQHWHIGNTLTFTPLRDLEIFKLFLQLPFESAVSQILESSISKKLIAMNDTNLLCYLSNSKNKESLSNVWELYKSNITAAD
jgi:hypothetical protein